MKKRYSFITAALLVTLGGCHDNPNPEEEGAPPDAGPFLSDEPLWALEAPEALSNSCFGNSVALGDVNGDGKKDLLVASPPCPMARNGEKGHLLIYAGEGSSFSGEPFITELDWQNPNLRATGRNSVVELGDVNGDRFADILIRSQSAGVLVFAGGEDLAAVLQAPVYRVPVNHRGSHLVDLDGDGLDELVMLQGTQVSIRRATPEGPEAFVLWKTLPESLSSLTPAGDTNGDGAEELLLGGSASWLYLGCKVEEPGVCEAGLSVQPSWSASERVTGFIPDQNGDGYSDVAIADMGQVRVYLFQPEGGFSAAPIWTLLGDAAFPGLMTPPLFVGELDQDTQTKDFLVGTYGRLYAFFPKGAISSELRAGWAWPGSNSLQPDFPGFVRYAAIPAGDLNGDGYEDLIAGLSPPYDTLAPTQLERPGRVVAFRGGKVRPDSPAPSLREPTVCGLASTSGGKPDVTVDADIIQRSLLVDRRDFAETACEVVEGCVGAPGNRRLLRFTVSIPNLGKAPVRIPSPQERDDLYYFDQCHQHHHLTGFARYELLDAESAAVSVGRKQGFFMVDLTPYCSDVGPRVVNTDGSQGISPGWADVYVANYPCQWLDITDVPDGVYTLRVGVDENNLIDEEDVLPNTADVKVRLTGDSVQVLP